LDKFSLPILPPVGILPLGTGNDLARTLGWGSGYSGELLSPLLDQIEESLIVDLDRWKVSFSDNSETRIMNNYMSVGVDAQVALEFHTLRNEKPELFASQFVNKLWYAQFGLKNMFYGIEELGKFLRLEIDGVVKQIPPGVGGVIVLNIPSYAGGSDLWGQYEDSQFVVPSFNDKILEVVAISGSFHMGTIQVNLSSATRIAQGKTIKLSFSKELAMQVDGEPFVQQPCQVSVNFWNQAKLLYKSHGNGEETEVEIAQIQKENKFLTSENVRLQMELNKTKLELDEKNRQLQKYLTLS